MISKQKIEWIRSLSQKKVREKAGCFVAEGEKLVVDLLKSSLLPIEVFCTKEGVESLHHANHNLEQQVITTREMERISAFKNPSSVLALFKIPAIQQINWLTFNNIALVLDGIQDPGNLGTMVRTADWFGITDIICSPDCADVFNHKCVQATMGALARVSVHYLPLPELLQSAREQQIPVYGTFMEGENLYTTELANTGLILMGSEGRGISADLFQYLTRKISIPSFPPGNQELESLNVAVSAAIITAEMRRRRL